MDRNGDQVTAAEQYRNVLWAPDSEIVIALVGRTGTDLNSVVKVVSDRLENHYKYTVESIKLSDLLKEHESWHKIKLVDSPYNDHVNTHMDAGNELRKTRTDALALAATNKIYDYRRRFHDSDSQTEAPPCPRTAFILKSLKHEDEVRTLRQIYGPAFYVIGVHNSYSARLAYLVKQKNVDDCDARKTLERDDDEGFAHGQHTTKTFSLSDAFISLHRTSEKDGRAQWKHDIDRIVDIFFGDPYKTPERDEYCMFLAYAASLRSADLSRQVGAVLVSSGDDITATGCNEVPKAGGGQYSPEDDPVCRDCERGGDSNEEERQKMVDEIVVEAMAEVESNLSKLSNESDAVAGKSELKVDDLLPKGSLESRIRGTQVWDITEYGRSVHAEMEAILSCARAGVETTDSTLFTTTFPCHNCAKHIVGAGIKRVVYVEPYQKSKALDLHDDAIDLIDEVGLTAPSKEEKTSKVRFEPFVGVGARRFVDLFSMSLGSGYEIKRKIDGKVYDRPKATANVRTPCSPLSYLGREVRTSAFVYELFKPGTPVELESGRSKPTVV